MGTGVVGLGWVGLGWVSVNRDTRKREDNGGARDIGRATTAYSNGYVASDIRPTVTTIKNGDVANDVAGEATLSTRRIKPRGCEVWRGKGGNEDNVRMWENVDGAF
jgi:hypothetical protein